MQIFEVLDNCIDEVQGGHATNVEVCYKPSPLQLLLKTDSKSCILSRDMNQVICVYTFVGTGSVSSGRGL